MSRRPRCTVQPSSVKPLHILTVGLEHSTVIGFGSWSLGDPPHIFHRVFDADAADRDPLCWHGHLGWIEPEALLCKVKANLLHQCDEQFEVIKGTRRSTLVVAPAYIEDKAP